MDDVEPGAWCFAHLFQGSGQIDRSSKSAGFVILEVAINDVNIPISYASTLIGKATWVLLFYAS